MPKTGHFILHSNVLPKLTAGHYELVSAMEVAPAVVVFCKSFTSPENRGKGLCAKTKKIILPQNYLSLATTRLEKDALPTIAARVLRILPAGPSQ